LPTSSDLAIQVRGLAKRYRLGESDALHGSLREAIVGTAASALHLARGRARTRADTIWALDHVTFEVERGEVLGIVGRNGAGKTTLLKLLSGITHPTDGEARIWGRVGSLLEVGTGFHPDLTGRENILLNGAILGMRRREIQRKFDEIVEFAEVERFVDTPVKRYSSGMYLRLAFSVAAHLEPEILIVDEVLAVGDASFQRKCLGRMGEVSGEGRTVVLVSHNMAAIRSLTTKTLWLEKGKLERFGHTADVVADYLAAAGEPAGQGLVDLSADELRQTAGKWTAQEVRFESVALLDQEGRAITRLPELAPLRLEIRFRAREPVRFFEIAARIKTADGMRIFTCYSGQTDERLEPGAYVVTCTVPTQPLRPGLYRVELGAMGVDHQDIIPEALTFEVEAGHQEEQNPRYAEWRGHGVVRVENDWSKIEPVSDAADERLISSAGARGRR
jgi:lipopolysaccharide transport system ATP-binding protein